MNREQRALIFWEAAASALETVSPNAEDHAELLNDLADGYDNACAELLRLRKRVPDPSHFGGPNE